MPVRIRPRARLPVMKVIPWFGVFPCLLLAEGVHGQCLSTVNTFPYQEGFEAAAAWKPPAVCSTIGRGVHRRIRPSIRRVAVARAGASADSPGAFYGFGEQSWLESPCFDFSTLQYPMVSFKIFWECERTYDGMGFQYSLDQGTTWSNVGSVADQPDCNTQNWFNTSYINNMSLANPRQGWSGRVGPTAGSCAGGAGSNGWVTAKHCLVDLAGEPSVKFRFVFGAGTACNNYDGIAIDDIFIGETPPELPSFQSECFDDEISVHDIVSCAACMDVGFRSNPHPVRRTRIRFRRSRTHSALRAITPSRSHSPIPAGRLCNCNCR